MAVKLLLDGQPYAIEIVRRRPQLVVRIQGREHVVEPGGSDTQIWQTIALSGATIRFARAASGDDQFLRLDGRNLTATLIDPRSADTAAASNHDSIRAPMPGAIIEVHKSVGDEVMRGETIVTIESMKLQTALAAPRNGIIATFLGAEGDVFEKDAVIATLEPRTGED